ncbi:myosin-binding protein 2 [Nicotiana tabacum]|uniref:Myosin-binding protein 2 n=1 Tax=Nicotiana tabacum TaxID=4097 RepID=A0A1S3Z9R4_TOBAC|nr:PREDICTED: myosin-binding protein 2-like [Nicotiana tabacum]
MAANKFATMLHKNTNKITLILIYAILEWTLIILLLLNSLFFYLIIKFAEYFGLKPPCSLCSRVDHLFDQYGNSKTLRKDLLCEAHVTEISKLGFCSNHQKLAESQDMCEDCSSSRLEISENSALLAWMDEIKLIQNGKEVTVGNGEVSVMCSCCGVNLESKFSTPYILIREPSWDDLAYTKKGNLVIEAADDDLIDKERSDFSIEECCGNEEKTEDQVLSDVSLPNSEVRMKDQAVQACENEDLSLEFSSQHLDFFIECSGHKLVPIELIDSITDEDHSKNQEKGENHKKIDAEMNLEFREQVNKEFEFVVENKILQVEEETAVSELKSEEEPIIAFLESTELEEGENSLDFYAKECNPVEEVYEKFDNTQFQIVAESVREEKDSDVAPVSEVVSQMPIDETDAEVLVGTEILDLNLVYEILCQGALTSGKHEESSTSSAHFHQVDQQGPKEGQEKLVELKLLSVEFDEHVMNNQSSISSKFNEIEEDKVPEMPTSIDSFYKLHKKLLLLEKKDLGTEESLDGSVVSELEGGDTVSTIEHLKSALKAERKALHTLYTELEEERSASAVAANQTMAMINKLQEEKAAMQMEALHYQRMMEEQSEYDQEALQLLNELMVKREKEKQELEKELEVYRKRLMEYEAKEKMRLLKRSKDGSAKSGFSSPSCSNAEESDELSIDLNQEAKEDDSFYDHQYSYHKVHVDASLELEESFADFEEERMSILEQLKMLEEKLINMDGEDAKHFEDVKPMEESYKENGTSHFNGEINEHANGFSSETNGKHHPLKKTVNVEGKGLLPLFDAMSDENGDVVLNEHENGFHSNGVHDAYMTTFDVENKKVDVEEELDHLHERLQALEADKEFLKNCISSLKKGDKGMDLLHEILQHLRDLRNVELLVRSSSNGLIV